MTARRAASRRQRRRISPGVVFLVVAIVASVAFAGYAVTVREADQIPLLAAGSVVLGLTFGALAVYCVRAILRAGRSGRGGRALLLAIVGGGAAMVAVGSLAAAIILFQLAGSGA
jgi:hypothetical protein